MPHNLVSKYRALQARSAWWAPSTDWAELLEQARRKEYRAGGPLPPKFVAAVNEGIPAKHRPAAWMLLTGAEARKAAQPQLYERLVAASAPRSVEEAVELDVRRTFPEHNRLTPEFVERMRRVLLAYAKRNPEVGYCQGMNFVAASILLFLEAEEDAFWLLSYVVEEVLPDHYVQSMIGHTVDRQVAEQLVELHLPALSNHLRELSLSMPFVTTHWFLCLFVTGACITSAATPPSRRDVLSLCCQRVCCCTVCSCATQRCPLRALSGCGTSSCVTTRRGSFAVHSPSSQ